MGKRSYQGRKRTSENVQPSATNRPDIVTAPPAKRRVSRWILIAGLFLVSMVATFGVVRSFLAPTLPDEIVGTWKATNGALEGQTVTFERSGAFRVNGEQKATVTLRNGLLQFHFTLATGETGTEVQKITTLNENELVTSTKGGTITMVRQK